MIELEKIEKHVVLRAPRARVWRAITNTAEFGQWFGIELHGEFEVGKVVTGTFAKGIDEQAIMERQRELGVAVSGVRHLESRFVFCTVERIVPENYFSFRWIPYGIDAEVNPESEPTTLVEFKLADSPEGTLLIIIESGFERVPEHRRQRAFRMNEGGWTAQLVNIERYVEEV